jgi:hypothetical protein
VKLVGIHLEKLILQGKQVHIRGENGKYKEEINILMTKAIRHPVLERLLTARFRTSIGNISIIKCYAPTQGDAEGKKNVYSKLNKVLTERKKKRSIII